MAMSKRASIPKKMRFEVLKRDAFACQYCGGKAPDVLLQIDHVVPVVDGGPTTIMNLVTSCEPCNNGKGGTPLSDSMALSKATKQAAELQARREQIEMMAEWQNSLVDLDAMATEQAVQLAKRLTRWGVSDHGRSTLHTLIKKHGFETVLQTMREVAVAKIEVVDDKVSDESCVAWWADLKRQLKWAAYKKNDPVGSELRYIRGIVRKRIDYCDDDHCLDLMDTAISWGAKLETLKGLSLRATTWRQWQDSVIDLIDALKEAQE